MVRCAALLVLVFACPATAQVRDVTLRGPPRDFGYFAGDVLRSRAEINLGPGTVLDARSLPPVGPVSSSIDIRQVVAATSALPSGSQVVVDVTYQTFFSPIQVARIEVPGYSVAFSRAGVAFHARVPGFSIVVSPFRHDLTPVVDPAALRGDHAMPQEDLWGPRRDLGLGGAVTMLVALVLLVDRYRVRIADDRTPFAAASRRVDALMRQGEDSPDVLLAIHRAFDATAARRVLVDDVALFLSQRPAFAELRAEIERFFATSHAVFFGGVPCRAEQLDLAGFCRKLARAERRS